MEKEKQISDAFKKIDLELTEKQVGQFVRYYELLIEKNKVMNLTTITEFDDVMVKHFLDSLMICRFVELKGKLIDVGTGAGFPGIPLKIVYPDLQIVLLDSLNKRVRFLNEVIQNLGLTDIEAVHGRAEDLGKQNLYREQFDFCVSRAVANLASLAEYCLPFVKVGGYFIAYKAGDIQEELDAGMRAVDVLGGKVEEKIDLKIPGTDVSRCLIKIRKERKTDKRYPRKAGTPGKEPIH